MSLLEWGISQGLTMNFLEVMGCMFIGILVGAALIGLSSLLWACGRKPSDSTNNTNKNEGGNSTKRG